MERLASITMRRGLRYVLIAQIVIAGLMVTTDLLNSASVPSFFPGRSGADLPSGPVAPGDQRRTYRTDRLAPSFVAPEGPSLVPLPETLPPRLEFSVHDVADFGRVLLLAGEIEEGDLRRLTGFLDALPEPVDAVALHSPGGQLLEALSIGRLVRDRELISAVLGGSFCLSSCPFVLAGGAERIVSRSAAIGLHQAYYLEVPKLLPVFAAVESIQHGQGESMQYLIDMEVDPELMVYALKTPPDEVYVLVEDELIDTKLASRMVD